MPSNSRRVLALFSLLCAAFPALPAQGIKTPAQLQLAYEQSQKLYAAKQYAGALHLLEPFYAAGPNGLGRGWYTAMYDLACDEALAGRREKAFEVLEASQADGGSVPSDHLAKDTDLISLHGDARFTGLLDQAKNHERLWTHEPGQDAALALNLSDDLKVAGLSTIWSEARFNFAFFDRQPMLDWNQLYLDYLPKVRATESTEAYYRVLMRFVALLRDGHTNAYPPEALADAFYSAPALHTRLLGDRVVVTSVDDAALTAQGWRVGDVLLTIGGEDVRRYAEREVAPYASASTAQDRQERTYNYGLLSGHADTEMTVTVQDADGKESARTLKRV